VEPPRNRVCLCSSTIQRLTDRASSVSATIFTTAVLSSRMLATEVVFSVKLDHTSR